MEKSAVTETRSKSRELQCIGRLEIVRPKPFGFLCGSIPIPTDNSFRSFNSALVPSPHTVSAPRYRMLPAETDLNTLPVVSNLPEKILPIGAVQSKFSGELPWEGDSISSNFSRKCDALAVSGLVEYGDDVDIIAPADILKQIFKMPYSKARLSIAVRRVGQTLVLNTGPDVEEGEKLVRRHKNQSKCSDHSLFLNFAMHSVRMEACDCPPSHSTSSAGQSNSSILSGGGNSQFMEESDATIDGDEFHASSQYPQAKHDGFLWEGKKNKRNKGSQPVKKAAPSHVGEKPRSSLKKESEKHKTVSGDGFLRVLFWQFHDFRMLLGSDLLLFSNEKYIAVSLHLWDVSRQITPLTWLEAWLDNVMASVPELAICYHQNGVVQGYELLKTDDIFLLKGISEDGTPAFNPHVVQQNGLSVLRFLHENCKQDPGAYWLHKSAGEDVIHLYDLSVVPKNHSSGACDDNSSSLPALLHRGRSNSVFSLGTLLYRIAHRLSLSMAPNRKAKCAMFFRKCLELLDEPDHLVIRASAHEQFARLLLCHEEELELTVDSLPMEYEVTFDEESEDHVHISDISDSAVYEDTSHSVAEEHVGDAATFDDFVHDTSLKMNSESTLSIPGNLISSAEIEMADSERDLPSSKVDETLAVCKMSLKPERVVADPISSKLAAVHHISQAIKSLRWMRQHQSFEDEPENQGDSTYGRSPSSLDFSVCACGDTECIEVCDIRQWLPTSRIDHKLWKLVLLLGESYLALGEAYKEDNQLYQALKVVELACSVYGSMPQHLDDARFVSSIVKSSSPAKFGDGETVSCKSNAKQVDFISNDDSIAFEHFSSTYLFWAKAWTLVGDVHVEIHIKKGKELSLQSDKKASARELRMPLEVVKEVHRLKKKLGQHAENCSSCSLVNCSCRSDRASSGSSASSSTGERRVYSRKHGKRSNTKGSKYSLLDHSNDGHLHQYSENRKHSDSLHFNLKMDDRTFEVTCSESSKSKMDEQSVENEVGSAVPCLNGTASGETAKVKNGGIFKYLEDSSVEGAEFNLCAALSCYEEARKALGKLTTSVAELQSVTRKMGWVCNELGRNRLERKDLGRAEIAFADAISTFREVSDYTNIILIFCNLGHGRRALAEEVVSKIENLKVHAILRNAYEQALQTAKVEYSESLRFYGAAKWELNVMAGEADSVADNLKNEVYTQLAHTYLRLGMLLAREDTTAGVYENAALEDVFVVHTSAGERRTKKEVRKHEISANDALREALSLYESLGELRNQESAYAHFQLACYQSDCCLKFLESDNKKKGFSKGENNILQRVKQYSSLAERNWQKAMDYYGPTTHPTMHLSILIERSALLLSLATFLHSNAMLEVALCRMLEGRHISETSKDFSAANIPEELCTKFWTQLQMLLKKMVSATLLANSTKSSVSGQPSPASNKLGDAVKLRELYKMSLKCNNLSELHTMHSLWTS